MFRLHAPQALWCKIFSAGRIKGNAGNLEGLISWASWCLWPHGGGKSPCSVNQTFFKCESQCLWYKTYRSGKGTREPSEPSLPSFDKGMGQIPMLYLQEEQDYMFTAAQLCTPRFLNVLSYRLEKESREPQIVESNYRAMCQHFEK